VKVFPRVSDCECSASLSGLLTYTILPCTPSPLASRCQLAPPAPSPLAHELTRHCRCAPRHSLQVPPPTPPCSCRHPHTAPAAAAASSYHRLCPVPLRYARCPPPPLCFLAPPQSTRVPPPPPAARAPGTPPPARPTPLPPPLPPRSCFRPPQQQATAANPCPRLRPLPGTCAAAATARGSSPGYPTPGTTYVAAAAAPVAASIPRPTRHQPLPPATLPGTYPHTKLSAEPPPPRGRSHAIFFYSF
jgi:hypothetical protein